MRQPPHRRHRRGGWSSLSKRKRIPALKRDQVRQSSSPCVIPFPISVTNGCLELYRCSEALSFQTRILAEAHCQVSPSSR